MLDIIKGGNVIPCKGGAPNDPRTSGRCRHATALVILTAPTDYMF